MFRTSEKWEAKDWAKLATVLYAPGTRGYKMIDVTNRYRYHVDVEYVPRAEESAQYHAFMLNHVDDVISLINEATNYADIRISIQSEFKQSEDYVISRVVEIVNAIDEDQKSYLVCRCSDGRNYTTPVLAPSIKSLDCVDVVWSSHDRKNTDGKP
jgi:hypothetical protein